MKSMINVSQLNSAAVKNYCGLTSCLLYGDWDKEFRKFVTDDENWNSMHEFSGPELLIIVPEKIQSQKRMYLPPKPDGRLGFMTTFDVPEDRSRDSVVVKLSDWFDVPFDALPCVLLFDDAENRNAYCLSFKDNQIQNTLKEFFSTCRKHVNNSEQFNTAASVAELIEARKEAMDRIIPEIRKRKIMKAVQRITLSDTIKAASLF